MAENQTTQKVQTDRRTDGFSGLYSRAYDNGQSSDIFQPTLAFDRSNQILTRQIYYTLSMMLAFCSFAFAFLHVIPRHDQCIPTSK